MCVCVRAASASVCVCACDGVHFLCVCTHLEALEGRILLNSIEAHRAEACKRLVGLHALEANVLKLADGHGCAV